MCLIQSAVKKERRILSPSSFPLQMQLSDSLRNKTLDLRVRDIKRNRKLAKETVFRSSLKIGIGFGQAALLRQKFGSAAAHRLDYADEILASATAHHRSVSVSSAALVCNLDLIDLVHTVDERDRLLATHNAAH